MNKVESIIAELERQRESILRAIEALSGASSPVKRRGRPPGSGAAKKSGRKRRGGKRNMSPEGRARIAEAARRRWAQLRAERAAAAKKVSRKKTTKKAAG